MFPPKPLVIVLIGPTASGKTELGIEIAKYFNLNIHNVDSRQLYRFMDIGTAKPTAQELAAYPHRLIDIRDPSEPYSAADFVNDADAAIVAALEQQQTPIIVGGTMLYCNDLLMALPSCPARMLPCVWNCRSS